MEKMFFFLKKKKNNTKDSFSFHGLFRDLFLARFLELMFLTVGLLKKNLNLKNQPMENLVTLFHSALM